MNLRVSQARLRYRFSKTDAAQARPGKCTETELSHQDDCIAIGRDDATKDLLTMNQTDGILLGIVPGLRLRRQTLGNLQSIDPEYTSLSAGGSRCIALSCREPNALQPGIARHGTQTQ